MYDYSEIVFVNYDNYKRLFKPGFKQPNQNITIQRSDQIVNYDHIVDNVRINKMILLANYINASLNIETFIEFSPGDISTQYSALLSKVVRSKEAIVKNPINEPYEGHKKSQIEEFIDEYLGSGIQHIAITTNDIISTIRAMRNYKIEDQ